MNYIIGLVVVAVGVILGFFAKDVNSILQWIVSGLYGGYIAANVLKWYWWRFNANGFFWGMMTGIAGALVFSHFFSGIEFLYYFPLLFLISATGCLVGTYTAPPTDTEVLKRFYRTVKPWGFWQPIDRMVKAEDTGFVENKRFKLDMFNVVLGIVAQLCLTVLPMFLILWMKLPLVITLATIGTIAFILKRTWWNKLEN